MVPKCLIFDCLSLFVYPVEVIDTLWASTYGAGYSSTVNTDRSYLTLCVRCALRALTPVNIWFGKVLEDVATLRASELKQYEFTHLPPLIALALPFPSLPALDRRFQQIHAQKILLC